MKSLPLKAAALALVLGTASCNLFQSDTPAPLDPKALELTAAAPVVIAGNNDFGIDLFLRNARTDNRNLMLSPLSVHVALTMLMNGSEGNTRTQIADVLGYGPSLTLDEINEAYNSLVSQLVSVDRQIDLAIANGIFYGPDILVEDAFLGTMTSHFDATIRKTDFRLPTAADEINRWASDQTRGKIPKVLESLQDGTIMILMNALYFKGDWTHPFDRHKTSDMTFHLADGGTAKTPTMHGEVKAIQHAGSTYHAIEIPYGRRNYSFVVILPKSDLKSFYDTFDASVWREITQGLAGDNWSHTVLQMPKFKFETDKNLNKTLIDMGMPDAFDEWLADLSGITPQTAHVDSVKQNTFIEVDEEGTAAAAVTTISIVETSLRQVITVDRPFVFAIRERTSNTLMFIGHVTDPRN